MNQKNNFKHYILDFDSKALKELQKIDSNEAKKIKKKLDVMVAGAPNVNIIRMKGDKFYRLKVGDYRVIFEVHQHIITILVVAVGHRKEIYRDY